MKKFVLVGTQRSGTTFTRHGLNSHDDILCNAEVFFRNYPDQAGCYSYKECQSGGAIKQFLLRSSLVKKYLYLNNYFNQPKLISSNVKITSDALSDVVDITHEVEVALKGAEFKPCLDSVI